MSPRSADLSRGPRSVFVCTAGDCHAVWSTRPETLLCPDCQRRVEERLVRPAPKRAKPHG